MTLGLIISLFGILCAIVAIASYGKYNRTQFVHLSNTSETQFNIETKNNYSISVEGVNHGQITKEMITLVDVKNNKEVELESIEHLKLKNRYKQKFYNNIFSFKGDKISSLKLMISTYESLVTHHSKYKIVEKYSKEKPPMILINIFHPLIKRLQFIPFSIGSMFLLPIGVFLIFKS